MKLNPHLHTLVLDGLYVPGAEPEAKPVFLPLDCLSTSELADLL